MLESPANAPLEDMFQLTSDPAQAPNEPEDVVITFERGTPVAINGETLGPVELLTKINALGAKHGVGRSDIVEDRMIGMKSRGVYETPGGTILYAAHSELEMMVLDRRTLAAKDVIAPRYADLVYEGRWWSTERVAMDALVDVTQQRVTGDVRLKLYRGTSTEAGRTSPFSLYDERFVTFGEDEVYEQSDAAGYIRLFALPTRVAALKEQERAPQLVTDLAAD